MTHNQLPALGSCYVPRGSIGQPGKWRQRQDMAGGIPSPSLLPASTCVLPEAALSPACSGPAHFSRGPKTWVWDAVKPNKRASAPFKV